ncbi:MAG: hypothetical protein QM393_00335 [Bacillota bacterium]|nr:hypothetical protein [Bacillota bacterium]
MERALGWIDLGTGRFVHCDLGCDNEIERRFRLNQTGGEIKAARGPIAA